jgi:hypothetical protein
MQIKRESFISGKKNHLEKVYSKISFLKPSFVILFYLLATLDCFAQNDSTLKIIVKDFHISADIKGIPLGEVVKRLTKETGIRFTYNDLPEVNVYAKIQQQPLEKGIKDILPLNTVFIHSGMLAKKLAENHKTIQSVIILSSLKNNSSLPPLKHTQNNTHISDPKKSEQNYRHSEYQSGIETLTKKVEESVVAYHWLSQIKNPDFLIRLEAVKELGELGSDTALQALYLALGDKNETVREEAQNRLRDVDNDRWYQSIQDRLNSPDPIMQNSALETIQTQRGVRWEILLEDSAQNENLSPDVRKKTLEALNKIRNK